MRALNPELHEGSVRRVRNHERPTAPLAATICMLDVFKHQLTDEFTADQQCSQGDGGLNPCCHKAIVATSTSQLQVTASGRLFCAYRERFATSVLNREVLFNCNKSLSKNCPYKIFLIERSRVRQRIDTENGIHGAKNWAFGAKPLKR